MRDYVELTYRDHPHTDYPMQLAEYLGERFHIPRGGRVLDYGCGRGDFVTGFMRAGFDAYGYDTRIGYAQATWSALAARFTDKLLVPDRTYDLVFSKSVIEHVHEPMDLILHMQALLKPGGTCIAMTPDYKACMYSYFDDYTHVHPFTEPSLKQILEVAGFDGVGVETFKVIWTEPPYTILMGWGRKP